MIFDVAETLEPKRRNLIEDRALVRNWVGQDDVESRESERPTFAAERLVKSAQISNVDQPQHQPFNSKRTRGDRETTRGDLATERAHSVDYLRLFRAAHSGEKWKTQQAIGQIFCDGTVALVTTKPETHRREM